MWQWILTGLALMAALIYAAVRIINTFRKKPSKTPECGPCSYDCTACKPEN